MRLFDASPNPYLVLDRDLNIATANRAYLQSTARSLDDIVGRWAWDAFPTDPQTLRQSIASFERVIRTGQADTMALLRFDIPRPQADGGGFETRYWSITHSPVFGDDANVAFVLQHPIDVTELERLRSEIPRTPDEPGPELSPAHSGIFRHAQAVHEANRALIEDRDRIRALFELSPNPIVVMTGPDLVIELVNDAYCRFVGRRDVIGRPLLQLFPELEGQGFDELLRKVMATGVPYAGRDLKVTLRREPDGRLVDLYHDVTYQPLARADGSITGVFCQVTVVTETHEAQAALRDTQERLREGMDAARMVVWEWQHDTGALHLSDNATDVLGAAATQTDSIRAGVDADDWAMLCRSAQMATPASPRYRAELRFTRPDNRHLLWLEVRAHVLFSDAAVPRCTRGVALDVTERYLAEQELRTASQRKDEFIAMLAHELRNPLAPIRTGLSVLELSPPPHVEAQTRQVMGRQLAHMVRLIDDLLDIARINSNKIELKTQRVSVAELVRSAVEASRPTIDGAGHRLSVSVPDRRIELVADPTRISQVISNLLNNAAKYTAAGGRIEVAVVPEERQVAIHVCDNGVGISAEALGQVFDLFSQGGRSQDQSQGGLGIGLALVKSLVQLHGGSVAVASDGPARGSVFTVRLPLPQAGEVQQQASDEPEPTHAAEPMRILVVDDNVDAADTMSLLLRLQGHDVQTAHDGHDALHAVQRLRPDIVFLDIGLPGMDGHAVARHVRESEWGGSIALVAVTGWGADADVARARQSGFDRHMTKPVDPRQLEHVIADCVRRPH